MKIWLIPSEVRDLLGLESTEEVTRLVRKGILEYAAVTERGSMCFDIDAVRRAADRLLRGPKARR